MFNAEEAPTQGPLQTGLPIDSTNTSEACRGGKGVQGREKGRSPDPEGESGTGTFLRTYGL